MRKKTTKTFSAIFYPEIIFSLCFPFPRFKRKLFLDLLWVWIFFDLLMEKKCDPNWANFSSIALFYRLLRSQDCELVMWPNLPQMFGSITWCQLLNMKKISQVNREAASKFWCCFQKKRLGASYVTKLCTMFWVLMLIVKYEEHSTMS